MATVSGYSADVVITLCVGDVSIPVAQVGNSGLLVRQLDAVIPPGEATLEVTIDGRVDRKRIILPDGVSEPNRFVKFF